MGDRAYAVCGPAPTIRATGRMPNGIYKKDGVFFTLTPREAARCLDIDDTTDIGERWGDSLAQSYVGNSMSVNTVRAIGTAIQKYLSTTV